MRTPIYWASFFLTLHYALLLYINSSFLGQFFSEQQTSLLYTASAVLTLFMLSIAPRLINRFRRFWVTLTLLFTTGAAAFLMSVSSSLVAIAVLFLIVNTFAIVLRFLLDIYLEQYSRSENTGVIRGRELTVINIAIAISPFLAARLLNGSHFNHLYLAAAVAIVPAFIITWVYFKKVPHRHFDEHNPRKALSTIWRSRDLRNMFLANLSLEFFYAWMVIYMPIYLSTVIGFDWSQIGLIFSIMLLPFVFLELPFGALADAYLGESELLTIGFFVMAIFTASLAFIQTANIALWALILFMTRVGASAVEIMSESHFFKNVSVRDANLVGMFRDTRPLAFIAAPLLGSVIIDSFGYTGIFFSLALLMLWGMKYGLSIKE